MKIIFLIALAVSLSACNNAVLFSVAEEPRQTKKVTPPFEEQPSTELPPTPEPEPELPVEPIYDSHKGVCNEQTPTQLLSCMNCVVPQVPPPPPQLSRKARELLQIMLLGCQVPNASDPARYVSPQYQELLNRLRQCSPYLYPDTAFQASEASTIRDLTGLDPWLRKKLFKRFLYQPPYSDDFASYFGLEVVEARFMFCYRDGGLNDGGIYPKEWWDADDRWSFPIPQRWIDANVVRENLRNCMAESLRTPYVPPTPEPGYVCNYETLSGPSGQKINEQISQWLNDSYKVGYEDVFHGICSNITSADKIPNFDGVIKVAAYRCQRK